MAVRALQIWATVVAGDSPVATRVFSLGGPPESLTLGTAGTWAIQADGVTQIHAKLHFDGERLAIAPIAEITIQGATIPRSGTILEAPVEIVLGGARIVFLQRAKVTRTERTLKGGARGRRGGDVGDVGRVQAFDGDRTKAREVTTSPQAVLRATPSKAFAVGPRRGNRDPEASGTEETLGVGGVALAAIASLRPALAEALRRVRGLRRRAGARGEVAAASLAGVLLILGATLYAAHGPARSDGRGVAERARASAFAPAKEPAEAPVPLTRIALARPVPITEGSATTAVEPASTTTPTKATRRVAARPGTDLGVPLERRVVDAIARGDDHEAARLLEEATSSGPANPTYSELLRILRERAGTHR